MRLGCCSLLLVLACTANDRAADSAGTQPAVAQAAVPPADAIAAFIPAPAPGDSACEQARGIVQRALNVASRRDPARTFPSPADDGRWTGCRFTATVTVPVEEQDLPEHRLRRAFDGAGWTVVNDYDAGGPDGGAFAYRRDDTLCHVADQQLVEVPDSGSPADTARGEPVPHAIEIRCTSPVPPSGG